MTPAPRAAYPCLRYEDAPEALQFLHEAFGFTDQLVVEGPDGSIAHAELALGDAVVMVGSVKDDQYGRSPRQVGAVTASAYLYVEDVDAHHARAAAAGAEVVLAPYDTDYGSREWSGRDLEGHVWSFGTYRP